MFGNTRFMAAVIVPLVATPSVVLAQDTPITGARFTLVEKTEAALSVTLENLRDSPLVGWEIGIRWADSKTPGMVHFSDRTASRPYSAGNGPIEPRSRRVVEIPTGETLPSTAVMRLAIFGDGHYEGQPEALQAFLRRQREEAEDLRYWIAAFNELPRVTSDDALTFLRRRLAQRAADRSEGAEPSSITAGVRSLLAGARPPELHWLISTITRLRAEAEQRMTRLVLPATPIRLNRDADVVSVRISSEPAVHHRLFGIVENLRDVPIEALGLDQFGADGRVQSGMRSDFCGAIFPEAGSGAIAPRERRELSLSWKRNPDGSLPAVRLTFVLFDDLKWEGSAATRDSLFKARERRAEDLAFWVAALSEAALQPPDKAREFLEAKKRERRATTAIAGNVFTVDADQVLDRIERTPAEFAGFAKMLASSIASVCSSRGICRADP